MTPEINLKTIAETAVLKKSENHNFGIFLKTQDTNIIDDIASQLDQKITPQIDCLECGNCCRNLRPPVDEEILLQFVEPENLEENKYAMAFACKNLDCNACTIYLDRPEECRSFPYMDRPNFNSRTHELLQNYEICPIVFNIWEGLKMELEWESKS